MTCWWTRLSSPTTTNQSCSHFALRSAVPSVLMRSRLRRLEYTGDSVIGLCQFVLADDNN
jgi:hypothetical protein